MTGEAAPHGEAGPGLLAGLLATEARLEAMLAGARAEAGGMLRDAEARARDRLAAADREVAAAAEALARDLGVERERRSAELERETARVLGQLRSLEEERLAELVEWVVAEVIDPAPVTTDP